MRSNGRKFGRGHHLVESGSNAKVAKIAVFEPRLTEARTFIFHYEITHMLLKWPKILKGRTAAFSPPIAYRASDHFVRGRKIGFEPRFGTFWGGLSHTILRPPRACLAHDALTWTFLEQMSIIWGTRGRKHPPGYRPGEGGYAKITKIAGFRGSPSQGTRRRFSLENCFKPSQMLKFFSLRGPH